MPGKSGLVRAPAGIPASTLGQTVEPLTIPGSGGMMLPGASPPSNSRPSIHGAVAGEAFGSSENPNGEDYPVESEFYDRARLIQERITQLRDSL